MERIQTCIKWREMTSWTNICIFWTWAAHSIGQTKVTRWTARRIVRAYTVAWPSSSSSSRLLFWTKNLPSDISTSRLDCRIRWDSTIKFALDASVGVVDAWRRKRVADREGCWRWTWKKRRWTQGIRKSLRRISESMTCVWRDLKIALLSFCLRQRKRVHKNGFNMARFTEGPRLSVISGRPNLKVTFGTEGNCIAAGLVETWVNQHATGAFFNCFIVDIVTDGILWS